MKLRIASWLSLLSSIAFIHSPALGMRDDIGEISPDLHTLSKKQGNIPAEKKLSKKEIDHLASRYKWHRMNGNLYPAAELVKLLVNIKEYNSWSKFSPTAQEKIIARITSRVQRLDLEELLKTSGIVDIYRTNRPKNEEHDKVIVPFILKISMKEWEKITPENRKWVIHKARGREVVDLDKFISTSAVSETYNTVRWCRNGVSPKELTEHILRDNPTWKTLDDEDKKKVIKRVTSRYNKVLVARHDKFSERMDRLEKRVKDLEMETEGGPPSAMRIALPDPSG